MTVSCNTSASYSRISHCPLCPTLPEWSPFHLQRPSWRSDNEWGNVVQCKKLCLTHSPSAISCSDGGLISVFSSKSFIQKSLNHWSFARKLLPQHHYFHINFRHCFEILCIITQSQDVVHRNNFRAMVHFVGFQTCKESFEDSIFSWPILWLTIRTLMKGWSWSL